MSSAADAGFVALKLLQYWPQPNRPGDPLTGQNNFAAQRDCPLTATNTRYGSITTSPTGSRLFCSAIQNGSSSNWRRILRLEQSGGQWHDCAEPAHGRRLGYKYAIGPSPGAERDAGISALVEGASRRSCRFRFPRSVLPVALEHVRRPGSIFLPWA